jgi:OOP family OmpA-OmpF porin
MKQHLKNLSRVLPTFVAASAIASALLLTSCANKPKADIASTANPQEEIARLDTDLKNAQSSDVDVLDFKNYDKAVKFLEEAKSDLASKQKQEEILTDLRFGRGALDAAKGQAEYRRNRAPGLLDARQAALRAGAATHPELLKGWTKTDREIIANSEDLMKLKPEKIADLQNRYVELERQGVIQTQLGRAKSIINGAKQDKGEKRAGRTLRQAQVDVAAAESVVSTNVRNEAGYRQAVDKANASARMLDDVMNTLRTSKEMTEATAIKLVQQNRQITDLKNEVSTQKAETQTAESAARAKDQELSMRGRQLSAAERTVAMQQALEKARQEFSQQDAEAYQQGENLVIRLKTVAFSSGRADLPAKALPILAKVSEVAKDLDASKIRVEGHTDSTGGEAKNQTLSEERANAVATYLKTSGVPTTEIEAEGLGLSKPLASNKTKSGRAQNRRVDIVITPGSVAKAATDSQPATQQ